MNLLYLTLNLAFYYIKTYYLVNFIKNLEKLKTLINKYLD